MSSRTETVRSGVTAEQMFQEAYLAEQYKASGNPVFVARGERILKSHEENLEPQKTSAGYENKPGIWSPDPRAAIEDDPRETLALQALDSVGIPTTPRLRDVMPTEMKPGEAVVPAEQIH